MNLRNIDNWNRFAGGISAANDKNSFSIRIDGLGEYHIDPVCWPNTAKHRGYLIRFANVFGKHGNGLWNNINNDGSLASLIQLSCVNLQEAMRRAELHKNLTVVLV